MMLIQLVLSRECGTGDRVKRKKKVFQSSFTLEREYSAKNWKDSSSKNMPKFEWTFELIEKKKLI